MGETPGWVAASGGVLDYFVDGMAVFAALFVTLCTGGRLACGAGTRWRA
jgi:hypothetical protein